MGTQLKTYGSLLLLLASLTGAFLGCSSLERQFDDASPPETPEDADPGTPDAGSSDTEGIDSGTVAEPDADELSDGGGGESDADGGGDGGVVSHGWTVTFGGPDQEWPSAIKVAPDESILVTGTFRGTVDLNPGPGEAWFTSTGERDLYVIKLGPMGGFRWARTLSAGPAHDAGVALAVAADGAVIVTGRFAGTVDFDPSIESFDERTATGEQDLFVVCLEPDGAYRWAQVFGGTGDDWGTGLEVAPDGSVLIGGRFEGTVDLDTHPEREELHGTPLAGGNSVISLSSIDGSYQWASTFTGDGMGWGTALAVAPTGAIVVVGRFQGSMDFDPDPDTIVEHTADGARDIFLVVLSPDGGHLWSRTYGRSGEDWATSVHVTPDGSILLTGHFEHAISFRDGPEREDHRSSGHWDAFVAHLDGVGDELWSFTFGGEGWDWGAGITLTPRGEILVTGAFEERVAFGPEDSDERVSIGGWEYFLLELDRDGAYHWVRTWHGRGWDYADDVAVGVDGSMVIVGSFEHSVDFEPCGGPPDPHHSNGESDTFVTRLMPGGCYR